nr:hypothetical protein [Halapricum sp. CBA1109]
MDEDDVVVRQQRKQRLGRRLEVLVVVLWAVDHRHLADGDGVGIGRLGVAVREFQDGGRRPVPEPLGVAGVVNVPHVDVLRDAVHTPPVGVHRQV